MGVQLGDLIPKRKVRLQDLSGKSVAIDAYNALYQFLSIIRGIDGRPLMDRSGRVTSHLSGLFYRTVNLVELGVKPVYAFDGKPPSLKEAEIKRRMRVREEAVMKFEEAMRRGDLEEARVYAQATATLKDYMVDTSKRLLALLGVPWVQAPSEGEAQAAHMAARGDVWAAASQDYDSLLFGAPLLLRNLTISGRRKLPRKNVYVEVEPEIVELDQVLADLGLTRRQLILLGILVGTDYNPEGVKGVGPKRALALVKELGSFEKIRSELQTAKGLPEDFSRIEEIFLKPEVSNNHKIRWRPPDLEGVVGFLCIEHDFSEERVRNALARMVAGLKKADERVTLESWLGGKE